MADLTGEDVISYQEVAKVGDIFAGAFTKDQLEEFVLKPIENRAFQDFAAVDVNDANRMILCKAIKLGIDRIRDKLNELVETGNYAKTQLVYSTRKDEDYE